MIGKVSLELYGAAVADLLKIALQPTHSGSVAAQVLLSAYNGDTFQLNVARLTTLDRNNFENAMIVIRGRYDTGYEPHQLLKKGDTYFLRLWDMWPKLKVENRGKVECFDCCGRGKILDNEEDFNSDNYKLCSACDGRGWNWPTE